MSRRIWKRLLTKKYKNAYPCWPPAPPPPPPPSSLFFESFLCCETLESDPERLKDSAPSDMELRRRDDRFFFRLPPPPPRFPFPVGPSVEDSPLVLIAGELGAFPSNSSKKSCNQSYTINSGSSRGTSILGEVRNVEIPGPNQQLLCSKYHGFLSIFALAHSKL